MSMIKPLERFTINATPFETKPGCWNYNKVEIFDNGEKIGEYTRNYSSMFQTFYPFEQDGKYYALYSKDYTSTRVMSLPDCKDICGEKRDTFGFCPTKYYVPHPTDEEFNEHESDRQYWIDEEFPFGKIGFIAGCVWGDDSSWKIQFLDLSKITEGILSRDDRFGYIELPDKADNLKDAISFYVWDKEYPIIKISCSKSFDLDKSL